MRIVRIYQPGHYANGDTFELSPSASQHVGVVLRMQPNDKLTLFAGDNQEFTATIIEVGKKKVRVTIDSVMQVSRESTRVIHLAQAISKGERMEFVIQKAVELGVTSVTPLITAHCAVRLDPDRMQKKQAQWQAIAIAACEQSGRNQIPQINPYMNFNNYLQTCESPIKWILSPTATHSLRECVIPKGDMALLIGPEGGLSEEEIDQAQQALFAPLRLGPRILRTETAAIAALSILQALAGDL